MKRFMILTAACSVLLAQGCDRSNLDDSDKILICESVLNAAKPECSRLSKVKSYAAQICEEGIEDAKAACRGGVLKDPSVLCPRIASKSDECDLIETGSNDVDLCKRGVSLATAACQIGMSLLGSSSNN